MRKVIIESPFAGDAKNIIYGRFCLRDSLRRGEAPLASHLLYTQPHVLDDNLADERRLGMMAGWAWMSVAQAVVVYTDLGISPGMHKGIQCATRHGLQIDYRRLDYDLALDYIDAIDEVEKCP